MKRVVLGGFALLVLAGAASAADQAPPSSPYVKGFPVNPIYSWNGFYIGANGGGGLGRVDWDAAGTFNVAGALAGGTVGYNWQVGQTVFGIESDVDWSSIRGSTGSLTAFCALGCSVTTRWLSTVDLRLGYAFGRVMPYVKGGFAIGDMSNSALPAIGTPIQTNIGWTVGGGVEFAIVGNWTAKGEYQYIDSSLTSGATAADGLSYRAQIFRAGINYRF
jgi:outer membrane immunogenic protein